MKLTYFGDQPLILKLFLGITKIDAKSAHVSEMPMFTSDDSLDPLKVGENGRWMDGKVNIWQELPDDVIAFVPTPAAICPHVTHGMIRCVELDLNKWVNKS